MSDYELIYGFNFNSTNPLPPPMLPSTISFSYFLLCISTLGFLLSSSLILTILRNNMYEKYTKIIQLAMWDMLFHLTIIFSLIPSIRNGHVPTAFCCNFTGFSLHWVCYCDFSCLAALAYDRLDSLQIMTKQKPRHSPHWFYLARVGFPLLLLYALLPVITQRAFGIYAVKPNSMNCYVHGGKGLLQHDIYVAFAVMYCFAVCFPTIVYSLFKSQRIITQLLNDRAQYSAKAAKVQKDALLFACCLILLFLVTWTLVAIHLVLLLFGISADWSPLFFNLVQTSICLGMALNPVLTIIFDDGLKRLFFSKRRPLKAGSIVSVVQGRGSVRGKSQAHFGSRVSHFDGAANANQQLQELEEDAASRQRIKNYLFDNADAALTEAEDRNLAMAMEMIQDIEPALGHRSSSNALVALQSGTIVSDSVCTVTASTKIRASVQEIAAYLHDFDSHVRTKAARLDRMTRARELLESNPGEKRSTTCVIRYRAQRRSRDRVLCLKSTCGLLRGSGAVVFVETSTTRIDVPESEDGVDVRAVATWVYVIKPERRSSRSENSPVTSSVECYARLDFKLPKEVAFEKLSRPLTVRAVGSLQRYFQNLLPLEQLEENDGATMGTMLLDSALAFHVKGAQMKRGVLARLSVDYMVSKNKAFGEAHVKYRFFSLMVVKTVERATRPQAKVTTPLSELSVEEGVKIGGSLTMIVAGSASSEAAVDEWVRAFPALKELEREEKWFRPFMNVIAQRGLSTSVWGLKARVFVGAGLSTLDMVTDVVMIFQYLANGDDGFAKATIAMVGGTMALNFIISWVQSGGNKREIALEAVFAVVGIKPAVDAWRAATGKEKEEHHMWHPYSVYSMTKAAEMFGESIPCTVLQMYAFLVSDEKSLVAVGSLAVSLGVTAFAISALYYDFDVNPLNRKKGFAGDIPDEGRFQVLLVMITMSLCVAFSRALGLALLAMVGMEWVWLYLLGDVGLHILFKLARSDFYFDLRMKGCSLIIFSLFIRVIGKVVVDFTGWLTPHEPGGLGGLGWLVNLAMGQLGTLVSVYVYTSQVKEGAIDSTTLWAVVIGSNVLLVSSFATFLMMINEDKVANFISLETGAEAKRRQFYELDDPALKLDIIHDSPEQWWAPIREDLKQYVSENYEEWCRTKPSFWNAGLITHIPEDFFPPGKKEQLLAKKSSQVCDERLSLRESVFE